MTITRPAKTLLPGGGRRPAPCRRLLTTARAWGDVWHLTGPDRLWRNDVMRAREVRDYSFVDWLYGSTALRPGDETPMFEALRSPEPVTLSA